MASETPNADDLYKQQNYKQAFSIYTKQAKAGNPHAYYQLGTMHYNGQGTEANLLGALIWFSLAAEYQIDDSEEVLAQLLQSVADDQLEKVLQVITDFKKKYGKQQFQQKYLPVMIDDNKNKKVIFGSEGKHKNQLDLSDELVDEDISDYFSDDSFTEDDIDDTFGADSSDDFSSSNLFDRPYLAVVDYDIAVDGSIRNMNNIESFGRVSQALYDLSITNIPTPTFDGKPVSFVNRSYLGVANYNMHRVREDNKELYNWLTRRIKRLSKSSDINDRFQYARTLLLLKWLPQKEGQAVELLRSLAEEGYIKAQYEYGLYLYREQIDLEQAIRWISLASLYGLSEAQYRLAFILRTSPWVITNEKKSLFWFELAAAKNHAGANLKAAELKLLAQDKTLHDFKSAIAHLNNIESTQQENPEFHYLVAVSYLHGENRDMVKAISHIRKAISKGNRLNWDVSDWEDQYKLWTTGKVYIVD
ncbi:tetratricopeptide repeat protein [Aliiglaciecola lipolytica]|uniref:Sel1 repeat family protein n=1 Tax=Aliiglaciecola lipolytica E3 TaxID=1127673 RepID=K6XNY7_9ALTE|nr:tetratricopeptide repeat protein [Aliiglaciecola lipolytica]GAC13376.1 hypothetical protein GLIP_0730 [Aliiglaciecola lipolytica E3]